MFWFVFGYCWDICEFCLVGIVVSGLCLGYVGVMFGLYVGLCLNYVWAMHCLFVVMIWVMIGSFLGFVRLMFGLNVCMVGSCFGYVWVIFGLRLGCLSYV